MNNILSYVASFGNTLFSTRPLNALDAMVFSQLVHLPLEVAGADCRAVLISDLPALLSQVAPRTKAEFMLPYYLELMQACATSRRYASTTLSDFVNEVEPENNKQFSAMRAFLPRGHQLIAFRGTDLSLAGWEEDFRISFESPVPAQRRAVSYVSAIAEKTPGPLTFSGHSKGGNLAVYAAAFCGEEVQARLHRVFSFDAPGQTEGVLKTQEYGRIRGRIRAFLPERSFVGLLLSQTRPFTVVACDIPGLMQHNPFNWQVSGGAFVKRPSLSAGSQFWDKALNTWLLAMTKQDREKLTRAIFDVLQAPGEEGFDGLSEGFLSNLMIMWKAAAQLPRDLRRAARRGIGLLLDGVKETIKGDALDLAQGVAQSARQRLRGLSLLSQKKQEEQAQARLPDPPLPPAPGEEAAAESQAE